jgi:putative Mn2+ efflux pump MntP
LVLIWEGILLAAACSVDAFAVGFTYGGKRIRIPLLSAVILTVSCTVCLGGALLLGGYVRQFLPEWMTFALAGGMLFLLGVLRFCDSRQPAEGDKNNDCVISAGEAALLSLALSMDGLAVGFGAGVGEANVTAAVIAAVIIGLAAVIGGSCLGNRLSGSLPVSPARIGGVILMGLGLAELLPLLNKLAYLIVSPGH